MKKILVTAFEPFQDYLSNSSMLVLGRLEDKDIKTLLLPVSYKRARLELINAIDSIKPDYVLSLGMAFGSKKIRIEHLAINYQASTAKDNDGVIKNGAKIDLGLDAIFTRFSDNEIIDILNSHNIPTELSISCGGFVCNTVYYTPLEGTSGKALFMHLPEERENFSINTMTSSVKRVIDYLKNIEVSL